MTDRNELETVIANKLKEELPQVAPGLTKQAYEDIITQAVKTLPKNLDKLEKYAGESMEKKADVGRFLAEGFGKGVGGAAAAILAGSAIYGIRNAMQTAKNNSLRPAFEQALKIAMGGVDPASEILRNNKQKARGFAETIFNFAPHVACDPNILKGILAHAVQGESIDPQTIRSLMELEEKKKNMSSFKPNDIALKG